MAEHAEAILGCAAAQGYGRCAFTERFLRHPGAHERSLLNSERSGQHLAH